VPDVPGVAAKILAPVGHKNIEVDMIVQNVGVDQTTDFTFTVDRNDLDIAFEVLEGVSTALGAREVRQDAKICKVSVVGVGMRSHAGVATQMFETLAAEGINIQMISTSEIKISVVVDEKYLELAVRSLHTAFELSEKDVQKTA
jgi:aspartate kinase